MLPGMSAWELEILFKKPPLIIACHFLGRDIGKSKGFPLGLEPYDCLPCLQVGLSRTEI